MLARHVLVAAVALGAATTLPACVDDGPGDPLGATAQEVDTTPPTVTLVGPSTVFAPGTVNLTATAADASGIAKVRLFRGLTLWKEDFSAPYTAAIPVSLQDLGTQYYVALAYDNAGNTAMSIISTTVVAGARPIIASFTATPGSLPHGGGTVTLAWDVPGANQVTVTPPLDANHQATITQSTVFTLTATNLFGTSQASRAVMVAPALPPTVDAFTATPASLPIGGGAATLAWTVTGAEQVTIDQGIGDVTGASAQPVAPTATTTYTLTATSAGGTVTAKTTIDVATPPPPRFLVGPGGVDAGDCLATPCRTIAYAAGRSLGVGHVVLLDGTYDTSTQGNQPIDLPAGTHLIADHPSLATVKGLLVFPGGGHLEGVRIDRRAPNQTSTAGIKATGGALTIVGVDFAGRFDTEALLASGTATVAMTPGAVTDYTALTEAVPSTTIAARSFVRVLDSAQVVVDGGSFGGPGLGCGCSSVGNGTGAAMAVADTARLTLDHVVLRFHTRGLAALGAGRLEVRSSTVAPHAASAVGGYGVLLQSQLTTNAPTLRLQQSTLDGGGAVATGVRTNATGTTAHLELSMATIMNATTGVAAGAGTALTITGQFAQITANATAGIRCDGACDVDLTEGSLTGNGTSSSGAGALWLGTASVAYHLRLRGVVIASNGGPGALNAANNSAVVLRGNASSTFDLGSPGDPGGNELTNNVSGPATTSLYVETAGITVSARDNTFEASVQGADAVGAYPNHGAVTGCGRNYCVVSGGLSL
ncbi:MAG: hypothetical protein JNK64_41805 [Myxococcales bacterium]|nr:hypothetical protein [Myxococcales bacterium]